MATMPAPGTHPKPKVTVSPEALSKTRIAVILGITVLLALGIYYFFSADVLWKFRWYSILNQLLIWTTIALVFGTLLDRFLQPAMPAPQVEEQDPEPVGVSS
jgi:hypothetical protein